MDCDRILQACLFNTHCYVPCGRTPVFHAVTEKAAAPKTVLERPCCRLGGVVVSVLTTGPKG
jgi:hypothetical protein